MAAPVAVKPEHHLVIAFALILALVSGVAVWLRRAGIGEAEVVSTPTPAYANVEISALKAQATVNKEVTDPNLMYQ